MADHLTIPLAVGRSLVCPWRSPRQRPEERAGIARGLHLLIQTLEHTPAWWPGKQNKTLHSSIL